MGWIPTGLFVIGYTCHRIENGGRPRNISNPDSGNSILLGTGVLSSVGKRRTGYYWAECKRKKTTKEKLMDGGGVGYPQDGRT